MPTACDHRPDARRYWQLQQGDRHGGDNCTAYAAAAAADYDTCGQTLITGAQIRAASTEPTPDRESPGLNLMEVRDAVLKLTDGRVNLTKFTSSMALDWEEYEERRKAGHGFVTQIDYTPFTETRFVADPNFKRGHAIFESPDATYDPLADGRRRGIFKFDGTLYPRDLIRRAAGEMVLARDANKRPTKRVGIGKVWCAMTRDRRSGHEPDPLNFGRNQMIVSEGLTLGSSHVMSLKQGTPLRRANQPGSVIVTHMSRDGDVAFLGKAGNGMSAVLVRTSNFPDGVKRPVILYVASHFGAVRPR